jgi:hypothetical protein
MARSFSDRLWSSLSSSHSSFKNNTNATHASIQWEINGLIDDWTAFFHAIDFNQDGKWIFAVIALLATLALFTVLTRKSWNIQMAILCFAGKAHAHVIFFSKTVLIQPSQCSLWSK